MEDTAPGGLGGVLYDLARSLGVTLPSAPPAEGCPVLSFARSGVMSLTGMAEGPPAPLTVPLLLDLEALCEAVAELSGRLGTTVRLVPADLLCQRAGLRELRRGGQLSAGGSCRLLKTADGWLAVNLARASDLEVLPAAIGPTGPAPSVALASAAAGSAAGQLAERLQTVGIAAGALGDPGVLGGAGPGPLDLEALGRPGPPGRRPLVVDFSAMWAGPLCSSVLTATGASVIKVEDPRRPDGARVGDPELFSRLHRDQEFLCARFDSPQDRRRLAELVERADVVLEASRPRALQQLGFSPDRFLGDRPGRVWASITGYGRRSSRANWCAFGDDAAVSGGLVAWAAPELPVFCADALADPLSGLATAAGVLLSLSVGGGHLVDASMAGLCASVAAGRRCEAAHPVRRGPGGSWTVTHGSLTEAVAEVERAPAVGARR